MGSPPRSRPRLSWRRVLCVLFLPFVSSGFAPPAKYRNNFIFEHRKLHPNPRRFDWSHLTPRELKNRSQGIQTEERAGRNPYFTLEGHEFLILGGSIHYFRVPRASWRDRLLKLRACGFNTVTTYVPWNLHEPERGTFDFSGNLDLEAFILLAEEVGLWVILRPGPYICSEMDLGGLPSWLLQDPMSQLRTTNRSFVNAVNKYFDHLIPRVAPLQYRQGGPIIAVQVENEYGFFYKDEAYMPYLLQALQQRGIGGLLLTADNTEQVMRGHIKGVLASITMKGFKVDSFKHLYKLQRHKPILIMEFWVGWFDTWGIDHRVMGVNVTEASAAEGPGGERDWRSWSQSSKALRPSSVAPALWPLRPPPPRSAIARMKCGDPVNRPEQRLEEKLKRVCLNLSDMGSPSTCTCSTGGPTLVS